MNEQYIVLKEEHEERQKARVAKKKKAQMAQNSAEKRAKQNENDGNVNGEEPAKLQKVNEKLLAMSYQQQGWEACFAELGLLNDLDTPIQDHEFKDPFGRTNKAIYKLYSRESFLYRRLNWAARNKEKKCVKNLGCFAAILSESLSIANKFRRD